MMYYCDYCQKAVAPVWQWETTQKDEQERVPLCPFCREALDYEADKCPLCGEMKSERHIICRTCYKELNIDFNALLSRYTSATADQTTVKDIIRDIYFE